MADNLNGEDNDDEDDVDHGIGEDEEEVEVEEDELNGGYEGTEEDAELERYLREFSQGVSGNRARTAPLRAGKHIE